jgi:ABC-type nitrate/sulfonate/bicarbonate transport system substrate-binding protein
MKRSTLYILLALAVVANVIAIVVFRSRDTITQRPELRVAIAPYQDLAMLVNVEPLGLEKRDGLDVRLITMAWEDILPAVASHGPTVDVGFGSLVEYLTKYHKLNDGASDPIVFVQPLYVYKGGGFVALRPEIQALDATALKDPARVAEALQLRFGAQKQSLYEMMLFTVARRAGVPTESLKITDISMNDGILALQSGSLDVTSAGLTQLNEAQKRGGHLVISMEDTGFADIVGFICRQSTLKERRSDIEALVRMWFECVDHVMADLEKNSEHSLIYLRQNAATQYTFEEYAAALSQEYLPRSLTALDEGLLRPSSPFDIERITREVIDYLIANDLVTDRPPTPDHLLPNR